MALSIFVFISIFGTLLTPRPAYAMPVEIGVDLPRVTSDIFAKFGKLLEIAVVNGAVQAVGYFTRKIAYDMAVGLASGNWGQGPFAHDTTFGSYLLDTANEAGGKMLEKLGQPFGLNLCKIPDARLDLTLRIGLGLRFNPDSASGKDGKPECKLTDSALWSGSQWKSQYTGENLADRFNKDFSVDQSDFGIMFAASEKIDSARSEQKASAAAQRQENQGAKGVTDLISGKIVTPGQVMKKQFEDKSPSEQQKMSQAQIGNAMSSGMAQVIPSALSTFLNTYLALKLESLFKPGMMPSAGGNASAPNDYTAESSGRQRAQDVFSQELNTAAGSISSGDNFDFLSQLFTCPDDGNFGPYNCVIDEGLQKALQQANYGNPPSSFTIAEALKGDMLHKNWKLIPPTNPSANEDRSCRNSAYCYGNIKILRQLRVLPLGFEIAASLSDPNNPWTLEKVVAGFDDCNRDPVSGVIINDPERKPYCHLIDPNWVIKLPTTKCKAMAYGSTLQAPGLPSRMQDCVDVQSCVGTNPNGSCYAYGYCTREKNVWRFAASTCDSQYGTCKRFTNANTGQDVSYLYRTLDTADCNQDTVGCTAYSLLQGGRYDWQDRDINGNNTSVFFNKNLSSTCSANSVGCSIFNLKEPVKDASGDEISQAYLKKAPSFFGCYYTASGRWPQTPAELAALRPKEECKDYAQPCISDEVGCNRYTPVSFLSNEVPGKFLPAVFTPDGNNVQLWNDQCDQKCVGYAAYKELESNYANGQDLVYITPPSPYNTATAAKACTAEESGCASFTNLNQNVGQMEKVEYYAFLRQCIKPDPVRQKNFYTYEGSIEGFQLKVFNLVQDTDGTSDNTGRAGGPKYFYRTAADLAQMQSSCNATAYRNKTANSDCREFNDDQGNIYYRILANTIVVSDQCTDYRLNNTDLYTEPAYANNAAGCAANKGFYNNNTCQLCFQGGEYRDGFCFYSGLPSGVATTAGEASRVCSAEVETCRQYKGNTGNNVDEIFNDKFESSSTTEALANWDVNRGQITLAAESTHTTEHSLGYAGNGSVYKNLTLNTNESYYLTFWAKGNAQTINVSLNDATNVQIVGLGSASVSDVWRQYRLGPANLGGINQPVRLTFTTGVNGRLFLDNVQFTKVNSTLYLVKKTLAVDPICDSNQNDNLPGEALGCQEYKNQSNNPIWLTNFSYLCRNNAVGCVAVMDSFNTTEKGENIYNLWLPGTPGTETKIDLGEGNQPSCFVSVGETGCYVKSIKDVDSAVVRSKFVLTGNPQRQSPTLRPRFVTSTVLISADTPSSTPMYLVADKAATCQAANLGCTLAGAVTQTPTGVHYTTTTIKNDPALYDTTICTNEAVGCGEYKSGGGSYYFKDPNVVGQKICTYKDNINVNGNVRKGWFWKGVGRCSISNNYCSEDKDCSQGNTCQGKDAQPCYPDYLTNGSEYDLWSFGTAGNYQNFVGECPAVQDKCTKFVDRNDNDKTYYLINDERLSEGSDKCSGQVSEREGCILVDNTEQPTKLWEAAATYKQSTDNNYRLVAPKSTDKNNSNMIVSVVKDRECAEWLYCKYNRASRNPDTGELTNKCYGLGVCNKALAGTNQCEGEVTYDVQRLNSRLDQNIYINRDVSWVGLDYSGWSLYNSYGIIGYKPRTIGKDSGGKYLAFVERPYGNECAVSNPPNGLCGRDNNLDGQQDGICLNENECAYPPGGVIKKGTAGTDVNYPAVNYREKLSCRGYPEQDSPFGLTVMKDINVFKTGFENVNLCSGNNCDCSYSKAIYGPSNEKTNYYGVGDSVPSSITQAITNSELDKKKEIGFNGWSGYCLERDVRKKINGDPDQNACLTWYPVDVVPGSDDIFNRNDKAAYTDYGLNKDRYICLVTGEVGRINNAQYMLDGLPKHNGVVPVQSAGINGWQIRRANNTDCVPNNCAQAYRQCDNFVDIDPSSARNYRQCAIVNDGADRYCLTNLNDESGNFTSNQNIRPKVQPEGYSGGSVLCITDVPENSVVIGGGGNARSDSRNNYMLDFGPDNVVRPGAQGDQMERFISLSKRNFIFTGADSSSLRKGEIVGIDVYLDAFHYSGNSSKTFGIVNGGYAENTGGNVVYFKHPDKDGTMPSSRILRNISGVQTQFTSIKAGEDLYNPGLNYWQWLSYRDKPNVGNLFQYTPGNLNHGDGKEYSYSGLDEIDPNNPLAIRIVWQNDEFKGIWLGGAVDKHFADGDIAFFFVIHFSNGRCEQIAQVASSDPEKGGSKPVTWRLRNDKVENTEEIDIGANYWHAELPRKRDMNFTPYGLVEQGIGLDAPIFANPFYPFNVNSDRAALSSWQPEEFKGGVPMLFTSNNLFVDGTYSTRNIIPYGNDNIAAPSVRNLLQRMFAKVYGIWRWSVGDNRYVSYPEIPNFPFDSSGSVFDNASPNSPYTQASPPVIAAPEFDCPNGEQGKSCGIGRFDTFTVNETYSGDVYIRDGEGINVRFYAWAKRSQMPLRRIMVDFDDKTDPLTSGSLSISNYKPMCDTDRHCASGANNDIPCINNNVCNLRQANLTCSPLPNTDPDAEFGSTKDTGCTPEYVEFFSNYTCNLDRFKNADGVILWSAVSTTEKYDTRAQDTNGGHLATIVDAAPRNEGEIQKSAASTRAGVKVGDIVCAYKPRVQVMDNWGWCNGKCSKTGQANPPANQITDGCYNDLVVGGMTRYQCENNFKLYGEKPWKEYANSVIVIPN